MKEGFRKQLTLDEVDQLNRYIPRNDIGSAIVPRVYEGPNKKSLFSASLYLHTNLVSSFSISDAMREVVQNMFDAIVEVNDSSFTGITFSYIESTEVTVIHNNKLILGEIYVHDDRLVFVNYGPMIHHFENLVQVGNSEKSRKKNQAGMFGEGLKRGILKFIVSGYDVEIFFPLIVSPTRTEWRKLLFDVPSDGEVSQRGCLRFKLTGEAPDAKVREIHCFALHVKIGKGRHAFKLSDYIVPVPHALRAVRDANDKGTVLLDKSMKDKVYVWHFYVTTLIEGCIFFGYDFFMRIHRDRNGMNYDDLLLGITEIWSHAIVSSDEHAMRFARELQYMKGTIEATALMRISLDAVRRLISIVCADQTLTPVSAKEKESLVRNIDVASACVVLPEFIIDCFRRVRKLENDVSLLFAEFYEKPSRNIAGPSKILAAFKECGIDNVFVTEIREGDTDRVKFAFKNGSVYLSGLHWKHCIDMNTLVVSDVPCFLYEMIYVVFADSVIDQRSLFSRFVVRIDGEEEVTIEPPKKRQHIVCDDDIVDVNLVSPPSSPPPSLRHLPPPGYKFYDGPTLFVKLSE